MSETKQLSKDNNNQRSSKNPAVQNILTILQSQDSLPTVDHARYECENPMYVMLAETLAQSITTEEIKPYIEHAKNANDLASLICADYLLNKSRSEKKDIAFDSLVHALEEKNLPINKLVDLIGNQLYGIDSHEKENYQIKLMTILKDAGIPIEKYQSRKDLESKLNGKSNKTYYNFAKIISKDIVKVGIGIFAATIGGLFDDEINEYVLKKMDMHYNQQVLMAYNTASIFTAELPLIGWGVYSLYSNSHQTAGILSGMLLGILALVRTGGSPYNKETLPSLPVMVALLPFIGMYHGIKGIKNYFSNKYEQAKQITAKKDD